MRILLADDHDLIRDTIEEFLKRLDKDLLVLHAATLPQALDVIRKADALDLVLLDLRMPGMNGLAGLKSVQAACAGVPIVILSGETNPEIIRNALQAGAAGFLPKTMRGSALLSALRLILAGERYLPDILVAGQPAAAEEHAGAGPTPASLTQREREVMGLLVQGLSNKEIGHRLGIEVVTVALHLRSVYRKLGVTSRTQAVRLAMEQGWSL
ncbi:MAG TPA: response regulator transcription factor [Candidatus Angelobacter sp.]|nr:response regulator transcription factor [Candidatus Angelobacter sp.]